MALSRSLICFSKVRMESMLISRSILFSNRVRSCEGRGIRFLTLAVVLFCGLDTERVAVSSGWSDDRVQIVNTRRLGAGERLSHVIRHAHTPRHESAVPRFPDQDFRAVLRSREGMLA